MRLDKFLKVAQLAKRRAAAKEALEAGRIESNGRPVKPAHEVHVGDELTIHYATRTLRVRVTGVPPKPGARVRPESLYEVLPE
jgi:ribosomal 50S subunit-recycling heat shock protein